MYLLKVIQYSTDVSDLKHYKKHKINIIHNGNIQTYFI
jgi:hypothetical protein